MKLSKEDLKTGMIVVMDDGKVGTVLLDTANGDIVAGDTWFPLESHTRRSITHIYQPVANCHYVSLYASNPLTGGCLEKSDNYTLVWSYEDLEKIIQEKQNALEELEKELEELRGGVVW